MRNIPYVFKPTFFYLLLVEMTLQFSDYKVLILKKSNLPFNLNLVVPRGFSFAAFVCSYVVRLCFLAEILYGVYIGASVRQILQ